MVVDIELQNPLYIPYQLHSGRSPLRLSLSGVISLVAEGSRVQGSDPCPPWLLHCDQTTACGCWKAVLPSAVTQLAAAGWRDVQLACCRGLALKAEGGGHEVQWCPEGLRGVRISGRKIHYPRAGFALNAFLAPILVEMIGSVAAEQKTASLNVISVNFYWMELCHLTAYILDCSCHNSPRSTF